MRVRRSLHLFTVCRVCGETPVCQHQRVTFMSSDGLKSHNLQQGFPTQTWASVSMLRRISLKYNNRIELLCVDVELWVLSPMSRCLGSHKRVCVCECYVYVYWMMMMMSSAVVSDQMKFKHVFNSDMTLWTDSETVNEWIWCFYCESTAVCCVIVTVVKVLCVCVCVCGC